MKPKLIYLALIVAVLDTDDDIVDALNHDARLEGVFLSSPLDLDNTFDAVMCVRGRLDYWHSGRSKRDYIAEQL